LRQNPILVRTKRRQGALLLVLLLFSISGSARGADPKRHPSPCNVFHPSDAGVEWDCGVLKKGETPEGLFGERWKDVARFNRIDRRHLYPGRPLKVPRRIEEIAEYTPMPAVYPPAEKEAKFILVDLSEQFLGAYEFGRLVFSAPAATGEEGNETPTGEFRITALHSRHRSTMYPIEGTDIPYPMTYALRFHTTRGGTSYWIHGRDLPGYPDSHGCIGLYAEVMQKKYYRTPRDPVLKDAKTLFEWVTAPLQDDGKFHVLKEGPRLLIVGRQPVPSGPPP
jgi:hypothetical protein